MNSILVLVVGIGILIVSIRFGYDLRVHVGQGPECGILSETDYPLVFQPFHESDEILPEGMCRPVEQK